MKYNIIIIKRIFFFFLISFFCINLCTKVSSYAEEETEIMPIYGKDINDGNYFVEVDSSSSMFRIVKANLFVIKGTMTMEITLSGTGYLKLFMGTGKEAEKAKEEDYIPYVEDEEGAYTYTIPVKALNKEFDCAAFSKRKQTWYDRKLIVFSNSLPEEAFLKNDFLEDGNYTIEATLSGGSGRASILSPVQLQISKGTMTAFIEWDSSNYDYMIVNEKRYQPINTKGNSIFELPISGFDQEIPVIADTTAMSKPYEIEYTITFHSDTLKKVQNQMESYRIVFIILSLVCIIVLIFIITRRFKKRSSGIKS